MTSQETLSAWLGALQFNKIVVAVQHTTKTWLLNNPDLGRLEDLAGIKEFKILGTVEVSDVMHKHTVSIRRKGVSRIQLMTIKETAPYAPSSTGEWGVNPASWRVVK